MAVKSIFDFRFPAAAQQEGLKLCLEVGHDMVPHEGYLDHEVIQDVNDPGHLMVNTLWESQAAATANLSKYRHDEKIGRATELMGSESPGFTGLVLPKTS